MMFLLKNVRQGFAMIDNYNRNHEMESLLQPKDTTRLMAEGYSVHLKQYILQGWSIFIKNIGPYLLYATIFWAINIGLEMIPVIGPFAAPIIIFPVAMGFFIYTAKKMKHQPARFEDFFTAFTYFAPLILVGILMNILIIIGFFLFILPGVYLAVAYLFASMLVVDRKMTPWQALETSRRIITKKWLHIFLLALILLSLNFTGVLLLIVGVIPATALTFCILTAAYDDIIGIQSTDF